MQTSAKDGVTRIFAWDLLVHVMWKTEWYYVSKHLTQHTIEFRIFLDLFRNLMYKLKKLVDFDDRTQIQNRMINSKNQQLHV